MKWSWLIADGSDQACLNAIMEGVYTSHPNSSFEGIKEKNKDNIIYSMQDDILLL